MLVTTPHKKKETKPNVRRKPAEGGGRSNGAGRDARRKASAGGSTGGGRLSNILRALLGIRPKGSGGGSGKAARGPDHGRRIKPEGSGRFSLPRVKPWKVILGAIAMGVLGVLYLNHIFATQDLLQQVQELEREYNQVRRANEDLRLTYDRMIGPAEIYVNAKELGFVNGGPAEKVIEVERNE